MKKQLENKLKEFADIRKFVNGLERKQLIDREVRLYLTYHCNSFGDWDTGYKYYKKNYKTVILE